MLKFLILFCARNRQAALRQYHQSGRCLSKKYLNAVDRSFESFDYA